jgi:hypothetical protein
VRPFLLATVLFLPALAIADHEHVLEASAPGDPPIKITINPEARVSVTLAGALPPPAACGTAVDFGVKIFNQGFVTSKLEAELVGDKPEGTTLDFHPGPLKGVLKELVDLRITLVKPGSTDLTLSFRTHNNSPDLGGRDRVHFLMHCLRSPDGGSSEKDDHVSGAMSHSLRLPPKHQSKAAGI